MKKPRKPTIERAQLWAHRAKRLTFEAVISGFAAVIHRDPAKRIFNREPWICQTMKIDHEFDICVTVSLEDGRRIRDQWVAAVAKAEEIASCEPGCTHCKNASDQATR
jgi:hypothetical protein